MAGIKALRRIQLAKEVTAGTPVYPPTMLWRGHGTAQDKRKIVMRDEAIGLLSPYDSSYIPSLGGELPLEDTAASFEQLPILLAAAVKNVVSGVADGGGTGKIYAYPLPNTAANTIKTYTGLAGDNEDVEVLEYLFCKQLVLSGKPGEALKVKGDLEARQVTSVRATVTATFVLATHKITAAAGLEIFKTGMTIRVVGSTSNDGVFTVGTGNVAGEIVVTEDLVGEVATAGVLIRLEFTPVAVPTVEEILFSKGKLYLDAVAGSFGGTLVSTTLLGMNLTLKTGWQIIEAADGALYFSAIKNTPWELTGQLTFEHNTSSLAEKAYWRAGTPRKMRLLFEGSALATAGAYAAKTLLMDLAGKWITFDPLGEQNGNDIVTATFKVAYDPTAAASGTITVVNNVASF